MIRCVCCKHHVHMVLGDGDIKSVLPRKFSWPLFTQQHVEAMEKLLASTAENEAETLEIKDYFTTLRRHVCKQSRDEKGRFAGPYLPKDTLSAVDPKYLVESWQKFVEGKLQSFNYIVYVDLMARSFVVPLRHCSLIRYTTQPPPTNGLKDPEWEGEFQVQEGVKVI